MTAPDDAHFRRLERMYAQAPINAFYAPVLHVAAGTATLDIAVKPGFFHAAGAIHGSVYFKALDDAAFFAANSLVEDAFVLTVTFTVQLLRPMSSGTRHATGTVVHQSRSLLVADAVVLDDEGRQVARGSGTFQPGRIPLTPEIGYR
jgi:uncharacterized protein (TIGR00369 family)